MAVESELTEKSYKPGSAMAAESLARIIFIDPDQLVVEHWADGAKIGTVLSRDADFIIEGDGPAGTATISALAIWPAADDFRIRRETVPLQPEVLPKRQPLSSKDVERGLDRQAFVTQEHAREIGRTIRVPRGEAGLTLPTQGDRANSLTIFDEGGNLNKMEGAKVVVTLDAFGRPVGTPVFDVLREIGTTILDDGTWGGNFNGDDGAWG